MRIYSVYMCHIYAENVSNPIEDPKYRKRDTVIQQIDKKYFLENIFDYEKNEAWRYQDDLPCVIDFYADWCQPCKVVTPVLEELEESYKDRIKFYKVDTVQEKALMQELGIKNLPTVLFCPVNADPVVSMGTVSKEHVQSAIEKELLTDNTEEEQ